MFFQDLGKATKIRVTGMLSNYFVLFAALHIIFLIAFVIIVGSKLDINIKDKYSFSFV